MVWRYGQMQPTSWEDALSLVAEITARVIKEQGEDGLFVSAFDHGGAGGGYENTWAPASSISGDEDQEHPIHNRPAYNSEVHATRDMGVGELNNATRTPSSPTRSWPSAPTRSRPRPTTS